MGDYGYLPVSRKMFDGYDPLWDADEVFDRRSAWIDLCQMAAYQPRRRVVADTVVELARGELLASERFLAERWHWTRARVRRFLGLLEKIERIEVLPAHQAAQVGSIVRLTKYETYNGGATTERPTPRPETQPGPAQERPKIEERKNSNELTKGAREEMEQDANRYARAMPSGNDRTAFNAEVRGIVSGDNSQAWKDPATGNSVSWEDRPRLLRLALDGLQQGKAKNLYWSVVYVVSQQYDPLPVRKSTDIRPDSEAAGVKADPRREMPGRSRTPGRVSEDLHPQTYVPGAEDAKAAAARREAREREEREAQDVAIAQWETAHELDARRIQKEAAESIAGNKFVQDNVKERATEEEYRRRVLEAINGREAA